MLLDSAFYSNELPEKTWERMKEILDFCAYFDYVFDIASQDLLDNCVRLDLFRTLELQTEGNPDSFKLWTVLNGTAGGDLRLGVVVSEDHSHHTMDINIKLGAFLGDQQIGYGVAISVGKVMSPEAARFTEGVFNQALFMKGAATLQDEGNTFVALFVDGTEMCENSTSYFFSKNRTVDLGFNLTMEENMHRISAADDLEINIPIAAEKELTPTDIMTALNNLKFF